MFKPPFTKVVLLLTLSDVFSWGVYYSITVIVGIYLAQRLDGNAVEYVGIGTGVYMFTRATLQLPLGYMSDRIKHDRDEIALLVIGNMLMGIPFLLYPIISSAWNYYILQFVFGVGTAMGLIGWRKLFAKNLDKNREGEEYAMYETIMSLATAILGVVAGIVGNISQTYFDLVITCAGVIMVMAGIWPGLLLYVRQRRSAAI